MSKPVEFLDLRKQYAAIKEDIDAAIHRVLDEAAFVGGKSVQGFEHNFAAYQRAKHCIGVGNGTDALEISIEALSLPPGSEILVPANTFIASSEAITRTGHRPVFCDCDPSTYTISPNAVRERITERTRAMLVVHLYGHPCQMGELLDLARINGLSVIEDCAQAHGAEYAGAAVGTLGDIGAFSFYPGKNLGAFGDAGAIVTNDESLARKCRMIANHGRTDKYVHEFEGRNSRLDALQAAVLDVKLRHLDSWIQQRRSVAELYCKELVNLQDLVLPVEAEWARHVWHLYVVRARDRDGLQAYLKRNNVQTGIHYPIALHHQKAYSYLGQQACAPAATAHMEQLLSLPIGEHIGESDVAIVGRLIRDYYSRGQS